MARLETQINQIFLVHPEVKSNLQAMYDEQLHTSHLFVISEIKDLKRKTESQDFKKLNEIILTGFKSHRKMASENLFESALAKINEDLADYAHTGKKGWVTKFSAVIALKSGDNLYLANSGRGLVMLKRKGEASEILPAEKKEPLALKTFQNFTMGKIKEHDSVVITFANLFDYVSMSLFIKILGEKPAADATVYFSNLLKDAKSEQSFAGFFLTFNKTQAPAAATTLTEMPIYAPLPEETESLPKLKFNLRDRFRGIRNFNFNFTIPSFGIWNKIKTQSPAGKFLLISFLIFALLFAANVIAFGVRKAQSGHRNKVEAQVTKLTTMLAEAEGSLIYQNQKQAFEFLDQAQTEHQILSDLDRNKAQEFDSIIRDLSDTINRVSRIYELKLLAELKFEPVHLARAGSGFLLATNDSKSLSFVSAEGNTSEFFLINNPDSEIRGLLHVQALGHMFVTKDSIYRINETQKQAEQLLRIESSDLYGLKHNPSNVYVLNKATNQILRISKTSTAITNPRAAVQSRQELNESKDFDLEREFYVLYGNKLNLLSPASEQTISLSPLTDALTNAFRMQIGSQIYILEPEKKRLLVYDKQGNITNQIIFENSVKPTNFYVDEQTRDLFLVDQAKLYKLTF